MNKITNTGKMQDIGGIKLYYEFLKGKMKTLQSYLNQGTDALLLLGTL